MKGKLSLALCAFITVACLAFPACAPKVEPTADRQCKVVLSKSEYYACPTNIQTVPRGSDVSFTLQMAEGYTVEGASYGDYALDIGEPAVGGRTVQLTLKNVKYSTFVEVDACLEKIYHLSVEPSSAFRCETPDQFVMEGQSATFALYFKKDYTFGSIDYTGNYRTTGVDSEVSAESERRVMLTIENVTKDAVIAVTEREALPPMADGTVSLMPVSGYSVVGYVLNGGWYIGETENSGSYYTVNYPLGYFNRPNTSLGTDTISRSGYVLTGWNTQADGNGKHIGLGSRADVGEDKTLVLYAEWAKWTDASLFDHVLIDTRDVESLYEEPSNKLNKLNELVANASTDDRTAVITGYHGNGAETLVIPERLGDHPVAVVAEGAVKNDATLKSVVLPLSMRYVMDNAFVGCENLTEVTLYDSVDHVDEYSFGNKVKTLRINAKEVPVYGFNESAQLANKMEMLVEHRADKKIVIFGSCSIWYSLRAETFGNEVGTPAYNMCVEGETCTLIQLDLIKQYMQKGDSLVYICDLGSPYLLGYEVSFDARTYRMFEANYDLLADVDLQRYTNVIPALNEYFITKDLIIQNGISGDYGEFLATALDHGDMEFTSVESTHSTVYNFVSKQTLVENQAIEKTKAMLQSFEEMGVGTYYGFGPISEKCLQTVSGADKTVAELNEYFLEGFKELNVPAKMLADIYFSILPDYSFHDTPYRLNYNGREAFTQELVKRFLSNR